MRFKVKSESLKMSGKWIMEKILRRPYLQSYLSRFLTSQPNAGEVRLKEKLSSRFPSATSILVEDISGGCGSMYQIYVEAADFKGLNTVKQHQLITQTCGVCVMIAFDQFKVSPFKSTLKEEIKDMHGLRITTSVPPTSSS